MATLLSGIQPLYKTGEEQGGDPFTGQGAYGLIPSLPKYTTDTAQRIGTDIGSQIRAQAPLFDPTMAAQWQATYEGSRGMIPTDVATNLAIGMSERGIGRGFAPGSPNTNAALARVLGLTSYQIQQNALANAQKLESMIPIQQTDLTTQTHDLAAEIAKLRGAPDPATAAAEEERKLAQGLTAGRGSVTPPAAPKTPDAAQMTFTPPAYYGTPSAYDPSASQRAYEQMWSNWNKEAAQWKNMTTTPGTIQSSPWTAPYDFGQAPTLGTGTLGGSLLGMPDILSEFPGYGTYDTGLSPAEESLTESLASDDQQLMDWLGVPSDETGFLGDVGFADWYDPSGWE